MSRDVFEQWVHPAGTHSAFIEDNCLKCGSQRCEGINSEWADGCPAWGEYNKEGEKMGVQTIHKKEANKCKWVNGGLKYCKYILDTDITIKTNGGIGSVINFCPFCGESLIKPVDIKVGMFGYFWDDDNIDTEYGILDRIDNDVDKYKYETTNNAWNNFKPGLPEGFNKDGTPIVKNRDWSEK